MRSPFTGLRFARMELDNFRASTMTKIAIAAVSLIPLIYAGLFLLAFLDPYGNLVNVPAAVVNEDAGAVIDGEERNVGQELCDRLVENNENRVEGTASGYDWHFVSRQDAGQGLADGKYYMELIVPEDFSENVASAATDDPRHAQLEVYFNPSTNLIAQTVGSSMVTSIKAQLNSTIDEEYFDSIFVQISDASQQLQRAVEGTDELDEGLGKLEDGSQELGSGLVRARDGSQQVTDGATALEKGAGALDAGVGTLGDNVDALKAGIDKAQQDSADLATVITGVGNALTAFSQTNDTSYLQTASALAGKVKAANPTIGTDLESYVNELTSALGSYSRASAAATSAAEEMAAKKDIMDSKRAALEKPTQDLQEAAGSLQTDLGGLGEALQKLDEDTEGLDMSNPSALLGAAKELLADVEKLGAAGQAVVSSPTSGSGPETLVALSQFQTALQAYQDAADEYQKAAQSYQDAATKMANAGADASEAKGMVTGYLMGVKNTSAVASESTGTVASAIDLLSAAVNGDLTSGADKLYAGAQQLEKGSSTLTLSLGDAVSGAGQISDGLASASAGVDELHDGIADGQRQMEESAANSGAKAEMMASPVTANGENGTGESITQVKNYGTGFAPYFISLGMWVGALMVSMIMHCLNNRILMSSASSVSAVVASYIPMALVGALQAVLLLLFIQFGLKMTVAYPLQFYLFGILTALAFMAIIQFFRAALGTVGTVVIIILLMVQLCTAAGTFPIESELPVFNVLNPFLPMTYTVHGFRMAMTGLSAGYMIKDVAVLLMFMVAFLVLTILWARHRRRVVITQLYRPLRLTE